MNAIDRFDSSSQAGGRLVAHKGELPLGSARLEVVARGGLARVSLEQRFENRNAEPLQVTYSLPLPADAVVSQFAFRIGERRVVGEIARREEARERFEEAIAEGRTAALLDQERSSLFTQELGNVPPGVEVVVELVLDQRLTFTGDGEWEWRFPTTTMPRYLGQEGRVADAERVTQHVSEEPLPSRLSLDLSIEDELADGAPSSPSHAIRTGGGASKVQFAAEDGVRLDRDVVVRWRVAKPEVGVSLAVTRSARGADLASDAFGVLTLVPPSLASETLPRDLIVLLDTSGSMAGEPLEQARKIVLALIDTLTEEDRLELIEFSDRARRFRKEPVRADAEARRAAQRWLSSLRASGSTEMTSAIAEALAGVRSEAQRQVVLVTDGAIGFEAQVISGIFARLPAGSRLHTIGVGSSVNRTLTASAARAGRGVEIVVGLGEDVERAAQRLIRRTSKPVVVELELGGSALREFAPARLPDLFAGAPVLIGARLDPAGGELVVSGKLADGGRIERRLNVAPLSEGSAEESSFAKLFARERVEDLELELAAGGSAHLLDAAIERLGLTFGIATRLTSWVAVDGEISVDPTRPVRRVRQPHELPYGTSVLGLGLRSSAVAPVPASAAAMSRIAFSPPPVPQSVTRSRPGLFERVREFFTGGDAEAPSELDLESGPPVEELTGKVSLLRGRSLVINILVDVAALDWQPGFEAVVLWEDEGSVKATVIEKRSTAPGTVVNGQTVRLWLELDGDPHPGTPRFVETGAAGRRLRVKLDG
jgi:Ca-activated chloride channel family protein